jgi:undecaprenyl-diphosphatase
MDEKLLLLINREWTGPTLDWVMASAASWEVVGAVAGLGALALAARGGFRGRAAVVSVALVVAVLDGFVNQPLERMVNRPRPREALANVRVVELAAGVPALEAAMQAPEISLSRPEAGVFGGRSFPSDHAANHFCAWAILWAFYPRWGWAWIVPAAGAAWARVYTGANWPSDVAVSALLGAGAGLVGVALIEAVWRRWGGAFRGWPPTLVAGGGAR